MSTTRERDAGVATGAAPAVPATLHQYATTYGYSAAGTALATPRRAGRRRRWWPVVGGLIVPGAVLAVWWYASTAGQVPAYLLPSPPAVVASAVDLFERGLLLPYIGISTQRVLLGFAAGAVMGLVLGAAVGLSRTASILLSPLIGALRAVPSLAWLPLLVLYLGIGEVPKVVLITIGAAFPVFTTLAGALRHVDAQLVELGRAYGLGRLGVLATVQLPAVIPSIVSGLRLALAQSWLFLVAAELIASSMGLGFLLIDSGNNGRIDRLFLAIVLLAVLGKLTDGLIGVLERRLLGRWGTA
ncbi:MAG: ABC transporter permease [Microbacteriaceae bacterium]|nr:ABC transporter permease [Microbacteriaceae bacterium]